MFFDDCTATLTTAKMTVFVMFSLWCSSNLRINLCILNCRHHIHTNAYVFFDALPQIVSDAGKNVL